MGDRAGHCIGAPRLLHMTMQYRASSTIMPVFRLWGNYHRHLSALKGRIERAASEAAKWLEQSCAPLTAEAYKQLGVLHGCRRNLVRDAHRLLCIFHAAIAGWALNRQAQWGHVRGVKVEPTRDLVEQVLNAWKHYATLHDRIQAHFAFLHRDDWKKAAREHDAIERSVVHVAAWTAELLRVQSAGADALLEGNEASAESRPSHSPTSDAGPDGQPPAVEEPPTSRSPLWPWDHPEPEPGKLPPHKRYLDAHELHVLFPKEYPAPAPAHRNR